MSLLADYNLPFAAALVLMVLIALLQLFGVADMFGDADFDMDADVDGHAAGHGTGAGDGLLSLLGIGRVPFMIWLTLYLLLFAALGVGVQGLAQSLLGAPLDMWLGAAATGVLTLPVASVLSRPLGHILPQDETTAVGLDSLVGRRGRIVHGRAAAHYPARARVEDIHGHPHHVMVVPHDAAAQIGEGEEILLVRRENEIFYCVTLEERRLAPLGNS